VHLEDQNLVNQAIKEDLERHAGQIEKIAQGIAAADRGEVIAHEDVITEMETLIANKT
jgi:predicted transcriptional regulator